MNTLNYTLTNLGGSLTSVWHSVITFLPNVIIALVLLLAGWILGGILGRAVMHLVSLLRIDSALQKAGLDNLFNGMHKKVSVARAIGALVRWTIIIAFVIAATEQVGLYAFSGFLYAILSYIPDVLVAGLILIATFLLGNFVGGLVDGSAKVAGVSSGVAGIVARYAIIIVGILAALAQLQIAAGFMQILFTGLVAAISLALGLAFGLGGRDAASRAIEKMKDNV